MEVFYGYSVYDSGVLDHCLYVCFQGSRFDEPTQSMMAPSVGETDYVAGVLQGPL